MEELITKMLKEQVKGQLKSQLAGSLGLKESQAADMIENSLPYLLGGLQKNTQSKSGAESLLSALQNEKHDGKVLEQVEAVAKNPEAGEGAGILKHIFGDKEGAIEADIAKKAGTDPKEAKKTLMVMAPMIMAALGKLVQSDKLNADKLSEVVGDLAKNKDLGGAGQKIIMQFLDQDGDGDIKDDFFRIGKRWLGQKLGKK